MVVMLLDALMPSGFWTVVRVVRHNFYCCSVCDPMVLYLMRRRLENVLVFVVERGGRRACVPFTDLSVRRRSSAHSCLALLEIKPELTEFKSKDTNTTFAYHHTIPLLKLIKKW